MPNLVEILITAKDLASPTLARTQARMARLQAGAARLEGAAARRSVAEAQAAERQRAAAAEASAAKARKAALGVAAGVAVIGVESVKMAARFDAKMALLQTQAGVSKDKIAGLKRGVLDLAGKVGQSPDSLAESLFHVESNFESMGISSKKALELTKVAAQGATVGHADLVDVTNALTAAVAANLPGVKNMSQAMGILNATVGTGDMKMQDLASALGTGMLATVAGFGVSIQDVGAALAVFGDNNKRGAVAATDLRMAVMAMAKPVAGGAEALKSIGLHSDTLKKDMQKGGLKKGLEDLVEHMHKAGISAKEQGGFITEAFGRKAGTGLNILVREMDRLESKYPALAKGAHGFGKAWADTQKTFAFQMRSLKASFDSVMIELGAKLIPVIQRILSRMLPAFKRLGGALSKAFGPIFNELLSGMGDRGAAAMDVLAGAARVLAPVFKDIAYGIRLANEVMRVMGGAAKDAAGAIIGAFLPASHSVDKVRGPFQRLYGAFKANEGTLREGAAQFTAFAIKVVAAITKNLPTAFAAFRTLATTALGALGAIVNGMAKLVGVVPGIGPRVKEAAHSFNLFAANAKRGMALSQLEINRFAASALPKLHRNELRLDIRNWQDRIREARANLKSVPPSKQSRLRAEISDLQRKVRAAQAAINSLHGTTIRSNWYLVKHYSSVGKFEAAHGRGATGGLFTGSRFRTHFDAGGPVRGPGTGTSDDVFAPWLSNGEFVMKAAAVRKYGERFMAAVNDGRLEMPHFARGGRVSKAEREARHEARGALTISHFGRIAGYSNDEFRSALGKPGDIGPLVDALNQWRNTILKATHGGIERSLLRSLDHAGRSLLKYSKAHDKLSEQLDKAKSKLSDLRSSFSQMRDSVASGIKGSANITQLAGGDDGRGLAVADIMGGLVASRDKASSFAGALKDLRRRGLSKEMLAQIAEAGIEGGGLKTAEALMGASGSELKSMNALQAQIAKAAKSAGTTAADSMYGAGIKAAEGLVKGLQKKEAAIEKQMMRIAKSMEKAIKHALGIHSPSRVMQEIGHFTAEGFAVGMQRNRSADRAWTSMLAVPPRPMGGTRQAPAPGQGGGGFGGRPIQVNLIVDGKVLARTILDPLRAEVRDRGGNVQQAIGTGMGVLDARYTRRR